MKNAILLAASFLILSSSAQLVPQDEEKVFLENIMIRQSGIYTLLGTKPMTLLDITMDIDVDDDEIKERYTKIKKAAENGRIRNADTLPNYHQFYAQYKKEAVHLSHLRFPSQWSKWLKLRAKDVAPQYLFCERRISRGKSGIFVNKPSALFILNRHKEAFVAKTGTDFNPNEKIEQIQNNEDPFWKKVFESHYLLGLLLGYGERNAFMFDWYISRGIRPQYTSSFCTPEVDQRNQLMLKSSISIDEVPVPIFRLFSPSDEKLETYKKERERIVEMYKGQNFYEKTMAILTTQ
jgi:hypothetical protein